jgi:hypothetical protein
MDDLAFPQPRCPGYKPGMSEPKKKGVGKKKG